GYALGKTDAAALFLERHGSADQARQAVLGCAREAEPRLSQAQTWQHRVLALPGGTSGKVVRDLATEALTDAPLTVVEGYEAVVVLHEAAGLPIAAVAAAISGDDPSCAELAARVLTRADVAWSDWNA